MNAAELPAVPGAYVIHFDPPLRHARNYLGSAANLRARIAADLAGTGARMVAAVLAAGSACTVSRTWVTATHEQAWQTEAGLKEQRNTPRFCPGCSPAAGTYAVRSRLLAKRRPNRNPPARRAA